MANDDDLQQRSFQSVDIGAAAAAAIAAALAALASGAVLRVQEILALADSSGDTEIEVHSSCVSFLRYNNRTGYLIVGLTDGSDWPYQNVSMFNFLRFVNARSKGAFFNAEVRGRWG
jgi:hypothetical protein